ncbi:dolichyl pyrophosphate Man9GlcNAc2 alpha-1,3-glucosyltransferase-like [Oscarella lobularis]|uniref:dolichyl pyrophosphate Man9GlcNAc2 alpha-1,3-glucosyltransferase-like n=1 Tax=Oscarella lobularis TaxID=121494 RepID=UPI003313F453
MTSSEKEIDSHWSCWVLSLLVSLLVRIGVSLHPYSGASKGPMYGDFEAQRHWMEITYNLPISHWYENGTDNNLLYWGLDYPPLTAYHSWFCGYIANVINPQWVALHSSRGFETLDHKRFMRYTVFLVDLLIYIPALFFFCIRCVKKTKDHQVPKVLLFFIMLLQPATLLIDHGHFQYNCVSLGFALWAIICIENGNDILASIAFSCALNYKQMELYHSFPFFFYLLGRCWSESTFHKRMTKFFYLGLSVLLTFILCWLPFLGNVNSALQVVHRLFPVARGLFEDKVANVWCSLSVIVKLKHLFSGDQLLRICFVTTLLSLLPSSINLVRKPTFEKFLLSLMNSSLSFFLFSFQVHEKSILLAALIATLLLPYGPFPSVWFLIIATSSMYPLFLKDGLTWAYLGVVTLFLVFSLTTFRLFPDRLSKLLFSTSICGMGLLHVGYHFVPPPHFYPDLYPVLISIYSCLHFLLFLAYFHYVQFGLETKNCIYWSSMKSQIKKDD